MPTASAAAFERSMTRPWAYGPRSLMRTTTELPVCSFVTRSWVPNGSVLCAAVRAFVLNRSPLAVRLPWKPGPYHEAAPVWIGWVSSAGAETAPSAYPRTTAVMARDLEGLVMRSWAPLMQCTIQNIAMQQKPLGITGRNDDYAQASWLYRPARLSNVAEKLGFIIRGEYLRGS